MLKDTDEFLTIESVAEFEVKIQGSRFIARALPVSTKASAERALDLIRREFPDATHHCYAYRIGSRGEIFRVNDDGEPSGTAGRPIQSAIDEARLSNILVVVVRYFGGTKLGTGGLVRSYAGAARSVIKRATIVTRYESEILIISFPHEFTGKVRHALSKFSVLVEQTRHDEQVHMKISVRRSRVETLKQDLLSVTSGNIQVTADLAERG
jgi:uncharacterized YigZ family protein